MVLDDMPKKASEKDPNETRKESIEKSPLDIANNALHPLEGLALAPVTNLRPPEREPSCFHERSQPKVQYQPHGRGKGDDPMYTQEKYIYDKTRFPAPLPNNQILTPISILSKQPPNPSRSIHTKKPKPQPSPHSTARWPQSRERRPNRRVPWSPIHSLGALSSLPPHIRSAKDLENEPNGFAARGAPLIGEIGQLFSAWPVP